MHRARFGQAAQRSAPLRAGGFTRGKKRLLPFLAFVSYVSDENRMILVGFVLVVGVWSAGYTSAERRQYAAKAWQTVDDGISTLEVCNGHRFPVEVALTGRDLRFRSQIAELTRPAFDRFQLAHPRALHLKSPSEVPILIAFNSSIAELVVDGEFPVLVLPYGGRTALKLQTPAFPWCVLDPPENDDAASSDDDDGGAHAVSGKDSWRYPWPCPLHVCRLAPHLRNLSSLGSVLQESAALLVGPDESFNLTEGLEGSVPGDRTIAAWQVKMDQVAMAYDRHIMATEDSERDIHLCADGSPQAGYHFMCIREESFTMSREQFDHGALPNNYSFISRRLPPMQTSVGNATVVHLALRLIHSLLLVCGDRIDSYRASVKSFLSDQGKECKINCSSPATLVNQLCPEKPLSSVPDGSDEHLFPNAVDINDHLHIFMNALQSAIESLDWWEEFLDTLRAFIEFFGDLSHIKRFRAVCKIPAHVGAKIKRFRLTVFSWRFENLEYILADLFAVFPYSGYFDLKLMLGKGKVANSCYSAVDAGFRDSLFRARAWVLVGVTQRTGHWMRWVEGCPCHDHLLISSHSYDDRRTTLEANGVAGGDCLSSIADFYYGTFFSIGLLFFYCFVKQN